MLDHHFKQVSQETQKRLAFRQGMQVMQNHVNREDRRAIMLILRVKELEAEVARLNKEIEGEKAKSQSQNRRQPGFIAKLMGTLSMAPRSHAA